MTLAEIVDAFIGLYEGQLSALDRMAIVLAALFVGSFLFEGRSLTTKFLFSLDCWVVALSCWADGYTTSRDPIGFVFTLLAMWSCARIVMEVARTHRRSRATSSGQATESSSSTKSA